MDRKDEALEAAHAALKVAKPGDPQKARAYYNIACYKALSGMHEEALNNLSQAILLRDWYKAVARADPDFNSTRNNPGFSRRFERIVT